jgi:hypothetical protein
MDIDEGIACIHTNVISERFNTVSYLLLLSRKIGNMIFLSLVKMMKMALKKVFNRLRKTSKKRKLFKVI